MSRYQVVRLLPDGWEDTVDGMRRRERVEFVGAAVGTQERAEHLCAWNAKREKREGVRFAVRELPALTEVSETARQRWIQEAEAHVGGFRDRDERRAFAARLTGKPCPSQRLWGDGHWLHAYRYLQAHFATCRGGDACPLLPKRPETAESASDGAENAQEVVA
jgi:hypothetical protein